MRIVFKFLQYMEIQIEMYLESTKIGKQHTTIKQYVYRHTNGKTGFYHNLLCTADLQYQTPYS